MIRVALLFVGRPGVGINFESHMLPKTFIGLVACMAALAVPTTARQGPEPGMEPEASRPELSLTEAFTLAQRGNRDLVAAAARAEEQRAALRQAAAQRKPTVDFSQRLTRVDDSTVDRANAAADFLSELIGIEIPPFRFRDSYRTQFSLNVPLWTSGGVAAGIAAAEQTLSAEEALADAAWRAVRLDVARHFFALATHREVLKARQRALRRANRRLAEAERRLGLGLTTRQEVLRWQVQVDQAEADIADSQAAILVTRLELADRLGIPQENIGDPVLPPREISAKMQTWADTLEIERLFRAAESDIDRMPEVRAAQAIQAANEQAVRRARAALRPRLDANATYGWLENQTLDLDAFANWSATLQFSLPIDLNGSLRAEIARSQARQAGALNAVADARAAARLEVGRAGAEVIRTRSRLRSAQRATQEANSRRELLAHQTEIGLTSLLDLLDADTTLISAEVTQATARVDLLAAIAALELAWPSAAPPEGGLVP